MAKRFRRSLTLAREWCRAHLHDPLRTQWAELSAKLKGHYAYYGVRGNMDALKRFRAAVRAIWISVLMKRSQTSRLPVVVALVDTHFALPTPRLRSGGCAQPTRRIRRPTSSSVGGRLADAKTHAMHRLARVRPESASVGPVSCGGQAGLFDLLIVRRGGPCCRRR